MQRIYQLRTINGQSLPVGGLESLSVVFAANGTYATYSKYASSNPPPDTGSYTFNATTGALVMKTAAGGTFATGVADDSNLVVTGPDGTVYAAVADSGGIPKWALVGGLVVLALALALPQDD